MVRLLLIILGLWDYPSIRRPIQSYIAKRRISYEESRPCLLIEDTAINQHIERVGRRIESVAGLPKHSVTFFVLNDRGFYAGACWTNIVIINTGMYRDFRNDDEMAAVLAHEVGHIVLCKDKGWVSKSLKESRADEYQADHLAVEFANKAGYKPNAAAQWYWRIMGYRYRMGLDIFTDESSSTHPIELNRIRAMNRLLGSY
jgi:predicted Zn-dependent protease